VKSIVDSLFEEANADLRMASRLFLLREQREMNKKRAVFGSRSAAFVAMMKSTDLRRRYDFTLVRSQDRASCVH